MQGCATWKPRATRRCAGAVLADAAHRLIETKGREDPDMAHKDRAARPWCENATALAGQPWRYLNVPQKGLEQLPPRVAP